MTGLARATLTRLPFLPHGGKLPTEAWAGRHKMVVVILWAHAIALPLYALAMGMGVVHSLIEGAPIAVLAWLAQSGSSSHKIRMGVATFGLVTCSAILVHISGGLIEMHFHFFVVVGIVTLYQSWMPFLLAIAYVVVHHGFMGSFMPEEIYNHADAIEHPWRWAFVHGAFILAMSAAGLAAWKFAEDAQERAVSSERKHFEEERRRLLEAEEAHRQLSERDEQLRQAQKMEAVGHLAGGIAHDFNNLLGVVVNYGRFVANELAPEDPSRADIMEIIKAGERGARLTRQLLTFSRKEVALPEILDLNAVVDDTFNILSRTITENIELARDLSDELWLVDADRGHIEQVLMNLVVNARDSMVQGMGHIVISTANLEIPPEAPPVAGMEPGKWVRLAVSDTGSGMSEETRQHIFEPFFTTKGVGEGTGLGLATVYGIVVQSGGHLTVNSREGHGTTFALYFPAAPEMAEVSSTMMPQGFDHLHDGSGSTVMVVEDEEANRNIAVRILEAKGYTVISHGSPVAALEDFRSRADEIDALLTDVVMPGISGKTLSDSTGLPTVFMSGYTRDLISGSGPGDGDHFLQKPFAEPDLLGAIASVLAGTTSPV